MATGRDDNGLVSLGSIPAKLVLSAACPSRNGKPGPKIVLTLTDPLPAAHREKGTSLAQCNHVLLSILHLIATVHPLFPCYTFVCSHSLPVRGSSQESGAQDLSAPSPFHTIHR